jgi:hypothetical protein
MYTVLLVLVIYSCLKMVFLRRYLRSDVCAGVDVLNVFSSRLSGFMFAISSVTSYPSLFYYFISSVL